jgi:hypothetical protein
MGKHGLDIQMQRLPRDAKRLRKIDRALHDEVDAGYCEDRVDSIDAPRDLRSLLRQRFCHWPASLR